MAKVSAFQAVDRGFESHRLLQFQSFGSSVVERHPEEVGVGSSTLSRRAICVNVERHVLEDAAKRPDTA